MTRQEKKMVLAGKAAALVGGAEQTWAYGHLYSRPRRASKNLAATVIRQSSNNSTVEASVSPIDLSVLQEGPGLSGYRVKTRWGSDPWVGG